MKLWPFRSEKKALTDEQILEMLGGGVPTYSGVAVSAETALRTPAVAAAVRTISEAAASLAVKVVEIAADGSETEVQDYPVVNLLKSEANEWTSGFELIRSLMVDALSRDHGLAWVTCSTDFNRTIAPRQCPICEKTFQPKNSEVRYCSRPCKDIAHRKLELAHCRGCGEPFRRRTETTLFCSRVCVDEDKKRRQVECRCVCCGVPFSGHHERATLCSKACENLSYRISSREAPAEDHPQRIRLDGSPPH